MAIYSRKQLEEQQEIISVVRALTAVTVIRLTNTERLLEKTDRVLASINDSLRRVFEIYPGSVSRKRHKILLVKPLFIFISANQELYGELINEVGEAFTGDLKKTDADAIVIGKVGRFIVERENLRNKISYVDLNDDHPETDKVNFILGEVAKYEKIVVYHGKNESLLKQNVTRSEISREAPTAKIKPVKKYFFEPSPEEVLEYLQDRIAVNGVYQKLYEGQVAKLSARRWNWTKQQLARQKLIYQLLRDYHRFVKGRFQKQQQVTLSAQRLTQEEIIGIV